MWRRGNDTAVSAPGKSAGKCQQLARLPCTNIRPAGLRRHWGAGALALQGANLFLQKERAACHPERSARNARVAKAMTAPCATLDQTAYAIKLRYA